MNPPYKSCEPVAVAPLLNAAFALDEFRSQPEFAELKALVDRMQQWQVLAPDESDFETLSAFLKEMQQLDAQPFGSKTRQSWSSCFGAPPVAAPQADKRPMTSTERRKQEKASLVESIKELQLQLKETMQRNQALRQELLQTKWRHQTEKEAWETERRIYETMQLRRAVGLEQGYADAVDLLLSQLNASIQNVTYTEACPELQNDAAGDAAVFETLKRNISENYNCLLREVEWGCLPVVTSEAVDAAISPDGNIATYKFARCLPFDIATVMDTAWRCGLSDFRAVTSRTVVSLDSNMFCVKEEATIHPAGQGAVTLCTRIATKRFVSERFSAFMWETVCDWSTPSATESTTTQESGWVVMRPVHVDHGAPVTAVQSLMKMTLSDTNKVWLELKHRSGLMMRAIIPSYQQIMFDRLQRFENRLVDEAIQSRFL